MEKLVPKLRFPEFYGNWEKKKINEIAEKINSGKTPLGGETVYTENGVTFIRSQNINDDKLLLDNVVYIPEEINKGMKNSVVKPNDILLNITGASLGRSCVVPENFTIGNVNQHVCIVRLDEENNPNFIQSFFSSFKGQIIFQSLQTGSGREGLNFESIKGIKINLPSLPEQQKIATFLTSVDERLTLLAQQKEKLELYKKGVMQQIFSQKLRFKDENGNGYSDWEEKKLGEVFNSFKGKGLSKDKIIQNGKNKCVLYGELYTKYSEVIKNIKSSTDSNDGEISKVGDILIPASTTTSGIDLANVTALNENGVLLGGDITILRGKNKICNEFYSYYLSNYKKYELAKYGQGTTIVHLYFSHFKNMKIDIPCLEEQQKIASFLSAIDVQIEGVSKKIEQTKWFKKGLLQQMFV